MNERMAGSAAAQRATNTMTAMATSAVGMIQISARQRLRGAR